jgi:hypothetical protein
VKSNENPQNQGFSLDPGGSQVSYGGTLSLTNLTGILTTNDSLKLFYASSYSGTFGTLLPSVPALGLAWNTNTLTSDGTLRIVSATITQPAFSSIAPSGNTVVLTGANGPPGAAYAVLGTSNLALPVAQWQIIGTSYFDNHGAFTFTDPTTSPRTFYRLRVQSS